MESEIADKSSKRSLRHYMRHAFWCTTFVYAGLALLFWLPVQFEGLNPLSDALKDFEFTDVIYSQIKDPAPADTNIVIVNIGELDTYGMAMLVNRIADDDPTVVGIDAIFNNPNRNLPADSALAIAFGRLRCLVLACKADQYNAQTGQFDSVVGPVPSLGNGAHLGFANFITEEQDYGNTSRDFTPAVQLAGGKPLYALSLEMCRHAYPGQAKVLIDRGTAVETIDYSRRESEYYYLDWQQATDSENQFSFRNKVVLLGFLGRYLGDPSIQDKFFTPMNPKYAGRSVPDMFGVVVHANIISQIKEGRFINQLPDWLGLLLGFIVVYINVLGFYYVNTQLSAWYDLVTKTIQLLETILILYLVIVVYHLYNIHLDLTVAIGALVLSGDLLEVYTGAFTLINQYLTKKFANFNLGFRTKA